jgi:2-iminobutanoate/2-iminopropanoate deaminase
MKKVIFTDKSQSPGDMPYSQAIKVGNTVYVAGQGPFEPITGECGDNTMQYQARRTLENVKVIIEAAGAKMSDIVKVTVFLGNGADYNEFNQYYKEYFNEPYPARAITSVSSDILVQIDAIAVIE